MAPKGLYLSHPTSLEHDPREHSPGHPDTPERLETLERELEARGHLGWERRLAPAASEEQLQLVHSGAHVRHIRQLCEAGGGAIDADTYVGEPSYRAALHAAGAVVAMSEALLDGEAPVGFCGVRPSGHHAERDRAMGFCLFDNIAVGAAAAIAQRGLRRVFVLDWDVHHGNGTAEIFRGRSDVLFASMHQSPLYPGTGPLLDVGSGTGEGYTINLPVPPGTGPERWMELLERVALRAAAAFAPELILVSAGFDAHQADPLADCRLQTATFVEMAWRVRELALACGAPLGVVLEGGYDRDVLAECVCAVLPALAGEGESPAPRARAEPADPLVERSREVIGEHWPLA
jgi:acetoin utilization deacetylase AcuC-like enzyme